MAVSAEFGTSNQYIKYYIEFIEHWTDTASNVSNVSVKVWVKRTNSYGPTYGSGTVYVNIAGGGYSAGITSAQKIGMTPVLLFDKNLNIGHNADGTGSAWVSASISHEVFSSGDNGWTFGMTTIPRASSPTLDDADAWFGQTVTIYTNRASASFTHNVHYAFGNASGLIASGVADSVSWTVPYDLANQIPSAEWGFGSIILETYSGGTHIGTKSIQINLYVTGDMNPSFTAVTHSENVSTVSTTIGAYAQNLSKLNLAITGAAGSYGSSITKYEITIDGVTYNAQSTVSNLIKGSGTLTITGKVTDSRGRTATKTVNITVLAYEPPKLTTFKLERANSDGTLNALGTYVKVTRAGTWNGLNAKNAMTVKIKSRPRNGGSWTEKSSVSAGTGGTLASGSVTVGTYAATSSHEFMIELIDQFNTTMSMAIVSTGEVTMSWGKNGIGIGKVWEAGAVDIKGDIYLDGSIRPAQNNLMFYQGLFQRRALPIEEGGSNISALGVDCNTDFATGFYMMDQVSANKPPVGGWFWLQVQRHNGLYALQNAWDFGRERMYQRQKMNGTWTSWKQIGGLKPVVSLTSGGQALAANSWYRVDWTVAHNVHEGYFFDDSINQFYCEVDGYYEVSAWTYFVQSIGTGFYLELWSTTDASFQHRTIISTWAPANGYNFYCGTNVAFLKGGNYYEIVVKHSDTNYTRNTLDMKGSFKLL